MSGLWIIHLPAMFGFKAQNWILIQGFLFHISVNLQLILKKNQNCKKSLALSFSGCNHTLLNLSLEISCYPKAQRLCQAACSTVSLLGWLNWIFVLILVTEQLWTQYCNIHQKGHIPGAADFSCLTHAIVVFHFLLWQVKLSGKKDQQTVPPPSTKIGIMCRSLMSRRNKSNVVPSLYFFISIP